MVKLGTKVRFDPMFFCDGFGATEYKGTEVTGTVVMVNYAHGWFSVEHGDPKIRTSFHFTDVGEAVQVIG